VVVWSLSRSDVGAVMISDRYKQMTKDFEGLRLKPYRCTAGKLTIGYGRNLDDIGISQAEANYMFQQDFARAEQDARKICEENGIDPDDLIEQRFFALTDMVFNLGINGTRKFKKLLYALKNHLYDDAADAMLDSRWAAQVGNRAVKLAALMRG